MVEWCCDIQNVPALLAHLLSRRSVRHPVIPHFSHGGSKMSSLQQLTRFLSSAHTRPHPHLFIYHHVTCVPTVLERKMSTRQSREELIKKGVLKEVYDKGEKGRNSRELSAQFTSDGSLSTFTRDTD